VAKVVGCTTRLFKLWIQFGLRRIAATAGLIGCCYNQRHHEY